MLGNIIVVLFLAFSPTAVAMSVREDRGRLQGGCTSFEHGPRAGGCSVRCCIRNYLEPKGLGTHVRRSNVLR